MYDLLISSIFLLVGSSYLVEGHDDKAYCSGVDKSYCAFNYHKLDCPHKCSKGFSFVGCFVDKTSDNAISGGSTTYTLSNVIDKCYSKAVTDSRAYFAVAGTKCYTSADAGTTYNKHGVSTACSGGKGAVDGSAIDVYKVAGDPGHWTQWGNWANCGTTCGKGTQKRTRTCTGSTGGLTCPGPAEESQDCYGTTCVAHTPLTDIAAGLCYTACDNKGGVCGTPSKTKCPTGALCCKSGADGVSACGTEIAAASPATWSCVLVKTTGNLDGNWGHWGSWGSCSSGCGGGSQSHTRTCNSPSKLGTGATCPGVPSESQSCNVAACPVPPPPSPAPCPASHPYVFANSKKCCKHPREKVTGGATCDGSVIDSTSTCCKDDAEVNCVSPTTNCVTQTDNSKCTLAKPYAFDSGKKCCEHPIEKKTSGASCDGGILSSSSTCCFADAEISCTSPPCTGLMTPAVCPVATPYAYDTGKKCCAATTEAGSGGAGCDGGTIAFDSPCCSGASVSCPNGDKCVHKQTSDWGAWSACTQPCGEGGTQTKTRTCLLTAIGGTCTESLTSSQRCNLKKCPTNGGYSQWSAYSSCTFPSSCGRGYKYRSRCCDNPMPANGGSDCTALGKDIEIKACYSAAPCKLDAQWNQWGSWGNCEQSCGKPSDNYKETRTRLCQFPKNRYGGATCVGSATDKQACTSILPCPINGGLTAWSTWSSCTSYCKRFSYRCCTNPEKNAQGAACPTGTNIWKKEDCAPGKDRCPPLDGNGNPGVPPTKDNGCKFLKNPPDNVECKFNLKEDGGATFEVDAGLLKAFQAGISGSAVVLTMSDDGSGLAINGDTTNCLYWIIDAALSKTVLAVGDKTSVTCGTFSLAKSGDKYNIVDNASKCTKKHTVSGPPVVYYLEQSSTGCATAHFMSAPVP